MVAEWLGRRKLYVPVAAGWNLKHVSSLDVCVLHRLGCSVQKGSRKAAGRTCLFPVDNWWNFSWWWHSGYCVVFHAGVTGSIPSQGTTPRLLDWGPRRSIYPGDIPFRERQLTPPRMIYRRLTITIQIFWSQIRQYGQQALFPSVGPFTNMWPLTNRVAVVHKGESNALTWLPCYRFHDQLQFGFSRIPSKWWTVSPAAVSNPSLI